MLHILFEGEITGLCGEQPVTLCLFFVLFLCLRDWLPSREFDGRN